MKEDSKLDQYYIPTNYNRASKFIGFNKRNIAETIFMVIVLFKLLDILPLYLKYKIMVMVIVIGPVAMLFLFGLKGESITQFVYAFLKFRKRRRKLYYLKPGQDQKSLLKKIFGKEDNNAKDETKNKSESE